MAKGKACECQWDAHFGKDAILGRVDGAPNHAYKKKFRAAVVQPLDGIPKCAACRDCHNAEVVNRKFLEQAVDPVPPGGVMKVHIDWGEGRYFLRVSRKHGMGTDPSVHALCRECVEAAPDDPEAVEVEPWFVRHYLATLDQEHLIQRHLARLDNGREP